MRRSGVGIEMPKIITSYSKNFPTSVEHTWNIPESPTVYEGFFFLVWGFGDAWGMLQGYVGILLEL